MYGLRHLSQTVPRVAGQVFSRKYIMLGRLVTNWSDIVGPELAGKTQPVKIRYYKSKTGKNASTASLDIAASTADATLLVYRKDLIIERINQIFGDRWITAIRFVPVSANSSPPPRRMSAVKKILTSDQKAYLSDVLDPIKDPDLQEKLRNLGQAILQDGKS